MNKKRSPKEIIEEEASKSPDKEHEFAKFPGKELIPITYESDEYQPKLDEKKLLELEKAYGPKRNLLHTHPYHPDTAMTFEGKKSPNQRANVDTPLPSPPDIGGFLSDSKAKSQYIAQYNKETGKVEGYFIIRKTSKTPISGISYLEKYADERARGKSSSMLKMVYYIGRAALSIFGLQKKLKTYENEICEGIINDHPEEVINALDNLSNKYHLRYRFVPAKDYKVSKYKTHFVKKSDSENGLERKVAGIISIIGLSSSILLAYPNLTGNAITNLPIRTTSFLEGGLLIVGLIAGFFYFKNKKK